MKIKILAGSTMAVALMGLGILTGSVVGAGGASAQTAAATATPSAAQTAPVTPGNTATAAITQQQAEQAALAASPGNTINHTRLGNENGTAVYDVDFTNGGGAQVDATTGKVIATEAAGTDQGGQGQGGADQAALAAKATVTQAQAEQTALAANPGSTVDHSRLAGDPNGTVFWDVDFSNGGGARVDAQTGKIIASEAAGTDQGGHLRGAPPATVQP